MKSEETGTPCRDPAYHQWAATYLCCKHFDLFITGLLGIADALQASHHESLKLQLNVADKKTPPQK